MIIGHKKQKNILFSVNKENIPHAFIFSGPAKIGKKMMALEFAKSIFCENKDKGSPCGKCYACRTINELSFPDFAAFIEAEEGGKESKDRADMATKRKISLEIIRQFV